jgi:hypothetical protein
MSHEDSFELLRADLEAHINRRVSETVGSLLQRVTILKGLAKSLEASAELPADAGADRLEEAAVAIRALATDAIASATGCIGISERLRAYASVRGIVGLSDDPGQESEAGALVVGSPGPVDQGEHGPLPAATVKPRRRKPRDKRQGQP